MSDSDTIVTSDEGLPSGTKAAIAILVIAIVFIAILMVGTFVSVRRRQRRNALDSNNPVELQETQRARDAEDNAFIRSVFARSKRPQQTTSANPFADPSLNPPPPVYTPGPSNINVPPPAYNG